MKTYMITFKDGTSMVSTSKRVTVFNETVDLLSVQPDTLYLNANEVRSISFKQT